jgi:hypothetical protein
MIRFLVHLLLEVLVQFLAILLTRLFDWLQVMPLT